MKRRILLSGMLSLLLFTGSQLWSQTGSFFEDFDNVSTPDLPDDWTSIVETTSSGFVKTATLYAPATPPNHVQFSNSLDAGATLILVSPLVNNFASNWLNLFTKLSGPSHEGNLVVGLMSDPEDASSFIPVNTIEVSGNEYQQQFLTFPDTYQDTDEYHIAFKFESTATFRNLLVDNIAWEEAPDGPAFSFSPEEGDFSWADINGERTRSFTISNTGTGTLTVNQEDVTFSGADADYFSVAESAVFPIELLTGESAQLPIVFSPLSAGSMTATLEIVHNADADPYTLELTGEALPLMGDYVESFDESTALPDGWSSIVEASTSYAGIEISDNGNAWSLPNHVRFNNSNDASALLLLVGPKVNNFEDNWVSFYAKQNNDAHEENVIVGVMTDRNDAETFSPIDTVLVSGNAHQFFGVSIPEGFTNADEYHIAFKSAPDNTSRILMMDDISWMPEPVDPKFTVTPEEGTFGDVYLNETSEPLTFVVNNTGAGSFEIEDETDIFISGDDETAFELIPDEDLTFPITLATGESFSIQATFTPSEIREHTATLNIVDDIGTKAVNEVPLSGMGYDPTVTPYVFYDFTDEFPPVDWMRFSGLLEEDSELEPVTGTWVHGRFGNEGEDNNSARINLWGTNVKHWLVTPPVDLGDADTDYQLEFDLALTASTSTDPSVLGEEQGVAVVISTDGGLTWSSENILMHWTHEDNISATGDNVSIDLKDYDGVVKIAFYAESGAGGFFDGVDVFVTNIEVKEREAYNLTFDITDEEGSAITDARIELNGMVYAPGFYTFNDIITGEYSYTISNEGYMDVNGQVTLADQDVTVEAVLVEEAPTFTLDFAVEDAEQTPITDAVITLDGVAYEPGHYVFEELEAGTYDYSVEKEGYELFTGEAEITDADLTVEVTLEALPVYTVTFVVEDENGDAVDDTEITFDGETYAPGVYVFEELLAATYEYSIAREGFITATGEIEVVDGDETVSVILEEAPYTLALDANPTSGGTLSGAGEFLAGETVSIEATPSDGYFFINWTDSDGTEISDEAATTITMPGEDLTLTANFGLTDYTVALSAAPEDAGTLTGENTYNMGDEVTVNATANAGYAFVNWTEEGVEVSDEAQYTFTMPAEDVELTAHFEPLPFNLTLETSPEGTGEATGAGEYIFGEDVTINAIPDAGYAFVNWTDEDGTEVSDMAEYTFAMPAQDITLTANFTLAENTLTLLVEPEGTGTVSGDGDYTMGSIVLISATPEAGYEFVNWTDEEGNEVSSSASHSVTMPAEDITYTANFQLSSYDLTLAATPEEGGTVDGAGNYEFGETVIISAEPEPGYTFENWTDEEGNMVAETEEHTFEMPAEDVVLTANFAPVSYELTIEVLPEEAGTAAGAGSYTFNEEVTAVATANEGFEFENWTDETGEVLSEDEQYTFLMPAGDLVLEANFVPSVAVDEVAQTSLRVYPNPSRSLINIEHNETILEVKVYSLKGQLVHTADNDHAIYQLNVDHMETGIYLLQVRTASGMATHRIQVIQ